MQYMAMAGQGTKEIYGNIRATANLANATMWQIGGKGGAADIMTNIMRMFRIESIEENATRVGDVLTRTVTRSNTNLGDLGEAIKYAGTTLGNLNVSLEQTAAMVGVLGDAGIQGSMAGTALANSYRYLTRSIMNPDYKGAKALKRLGLGKSDFLDAQGNLIDMGLAMQKIATQAENLGSADWFNELVNILGVRGERAGTVLSKSFLNYQNLLNEINNSEGAAESVREKRMSTLAGALEIVRSTWENLKTSWAESIAPTLDPYLRFVGMMIEGVQKLLDSPVGPFFAAFTGGVVVFTTLSAAVTAVKAGFRLLFNDSTISARNMFAVLNQGWKTAQIQAAEYMAIERAIIAQRKGGMVANLAGGTALWLQQAKMAQGQYIGGMMMRTNRRGTPMFYARNDAGGVQRISNAEMARRTSTMTPGMIMGWGNAGRVTAATGQNAAPTQGFFARLFGRRAATSAATATAGRAAATGIARFGIGRALGTIAGVLGGPWGMLAMTLVTFLPSIIDALKGNSDALKENTAESRRAAIEKQRQENIAAANISVDERQILIADAISRLGANIGELISSVTPGYVSIYIDGEEAIKTTIAQNQQEQIINVGAK